MRYYSIFITGAPGSFKPAPNGAIWSSHPWGGNRADPGAQQVEMRLELMVAGSDSPTENSTIVVKGVSWEQISQQSDLVNKQIVVMGGMHDGLPLANFQARSPLPGEICRGTIIKAWGNWIRDEMAIGMNLGVGQADDMGNAAPASPGGGPGTSAAPAQPATSSVQLANRSRLAAIGPRSMFRNRYSMGRAAGAANVNAAAIDLGGLNQGLSGLTQLGGLVGLDLSGIGTEIGQIFNFVGGGSPGLQVPINLIHNWMPGMPLSAAIQQTLSTAFPAMKIIMAISSSLKLNYQDAGVYQNVFQYAAYIKKLSQSILGVTNYPGVHMYSDGRTIIVRDNQPLTITTGEISPADLIGQPTWINKEDMHFTTVMRSDIMPGKDITLPPNILMTLGPNVNPAGSGSPQRTNLSFNGTWRVTKVNHVGDFRNPDGAFWSTSYECSINHAYDAVNSDPNAAVQPQQNPPGTPQPAPPTDTTIPTNPLSVQSRRARQVRYY